MSEVSESQASAGGSSTPASQGTGGAAGGSAGDLLDGGSGRGGQGSGSTPVGGEAGGAAGAESSTQPNFPDSGAPLTPQDPTPNPCEDFECPEFGQCRVQRDGDACTRVCTLAATNELALQSQSDVDRFARLRCHRIEGALLVGGTFDALADIQSIDGLQSIREVTGYLRIGWSSLTHVHLPELRVVAGIGGLYSGEIALWLWGMPDVESIRLPALERVAAEIVIAENDRLESVEMNALRTVAGVINSSQTEPVALPIILGNNEELRTLDCLPSLEEGRLDVFGCPNLPRCEILAIGARDVAACMACAEGAGRQP